MHFFVASITFFDEATPGRHLSSLQSLFTLLKDPLRSRDNYRPVHVIGVDFLLGLSQGARVLVSATHTSFCEFPGIITQTLHFFCAISARKTKEIQTKIRRKRTKITTPKTDQKVRKREARGDAKRWQAPDKMLAATKFSRSTRFLRNSLIFSEWNGRRSVRRARAQNPSTRSCAVFFPKRRERGAWYPGRFRRFYSQVNNRKSNDRK